MGNIRTVTDDPDSYYKFDSQYDPSDKNITYVTDHNGGSPIEGFVSVPGVKGNALSLMQAEDYALIGKINCLVIKRHFRLCTAR